MIRNQILFLQGLVHFPFNIIIYFCPEIRDTTYFSDGKVNHCLQWHLQSCFFSFCSCYNSLLLISFILISFLISFFQNCLIFTYYFLSLLFFLPFTIIFIAFAGAFLSHAQTTSIFDFKKIILLAQHQSLLVLTHFLLYSSVS